MAKIFLIILIFVLVFLGLIGYSWYQVRLQIHRHFITNWQSFPKPTLPYQTRIFRTSDGFNIYSWYIPVKDPKAVIILVHGEDPDGGKAEMILISQMLHDAGYSTLLMETRGVGQSDGNKITLGVDEWKDLEAAYNDMAALPENKGVKIGFLGNSMGGATSIIMTGLTGKGDFIIAIDPYASFKKVFEFSVKGKGLPVAFFSPIVRLAATLELGWNYDRFSPDKLITKIHVPIFITWSSHDERIGQDEGSYLFTLANEPKVGWETNFGHDFIFEIGDALNQKVSDFLNKYVEK